MTKPVAVMNTAFRDGFQSCVGARVFTDDFLPAVEAAVEVQTAERPPRPPPSLPFACAGIKHGVPWRGSYPRALLISQGSVSTADPETLTPTNTWQAPRDVFKCEVWRWRHSDWC